MRVTHIKLGSIVARLGLAISLIVALGAPGGYLLVVGSQLDHELSLLAEIKATKLAKYLYLHPDLWQYYPIHLAELTDVPETTGIEMVQRIFDAAGKLVLETGDKPALPVVRARAVVIVAGTSMATIETATSFRPVLAQAAIIAGFSLPLGLAIFWIIRIVLLRTLDRTLGQLEASEARYHKIVDSMIDAVFTTDGEIVTYMSAATSRVLGAPPEAVVGTRPAESFHPDDLPGLLDCVRATRREPDAVQTMRLRSSGRLPHGRYLELRFTTFGPPNEKGHYPLIGVVRDIHAEVLAERKQRDDMLKLRSIVESSGALIALVDSRQRIVLVNRTFLDTTGTSLDAVVGRRYEEIVDCGDADAALTAWLAGEQCEDFAFDQVVGGAGARRVVRVTASHVHDEEGRVNYSLFLGVDETERRLAEVRAIDASRLATLGEMATGIAHEINQPLTVVQFGVDAMADDLEDGLHKDDPEGYAEAALQHITLMRNQTQRAAAIVRRLRSFARKDDDVAQTFHVGEAVAGAVELLAEQMRLSRITVEFDVPEDLPQVHGRINRLQQVMVNLMINARDAINEARARKPGPVRQEQIDIRACHDAATGRLVVEIGDSGPGIPAQILPRLFESFFTTKPKGIGLGLSIGTEIMSEMQGTIAAENRPQGGALFRMSFPVAVSDLSAAA